MSQPTDLIPNITTGAQNPAEAEADGQRVKAHPIPDQITADRYLNAKASRSAKRRGLMFSKLLPAGCPADQQGTAAGLPGTAFDTPGGIG